MDALRSGMDRFLAAEQLLDANRDRSALRARNEITIVFVGGALLDVALAVWLAMFFTRSVSSRVEVVVTNVARLERNEPLGPPLGDLRGQRLLGFGADEIRGGVPFTIEEISSEL
mgnify:CR=1 FL=1